MIDLDRRLALVEASILGIAFKSVTTTRTNNTLSNDPDLQIFLQANSRYFVEVFATVAATTTAKIRTAWAVPAGTTGNRRCLGPGSTAAQADADNIAVRMGTHNFTTTLDYNGVRNSNVFQFQLQEVAIVTTAGTEGVVAFQWAQAVTNATGTIVAADSFMRATKLA
ncbi:MAG: hypothetical protein ABW022_22045 [Actinoplanes sp.]